jgi:hypothetical protein
MQSHSSDMPTPTMPTCSCVLHLMHRARSCTVALMHMEHSRLAFACFEVVPHAVNPLSTAQMERAGWQV